MKFFGLAASIFLTTLPAAALGAQAQTEPETEVVVSGRRAGEARKEAHSYIRELGVLSSNRAAARWVDPICPKARGISKELAAFVERQIRDTAKVAGARVAGETCDANFVVVFTEDAGSLVNHVAKRERGRLARPGTTVDPELERGEAPVIWWYDTEVRASSGLRESTDASPSAKFTGPNGEETPMPGNSSTTVTHHYNASSVSTSTIRAIYAATVIIDVNRAAGNRLRTLTDYAALVGLAEIDFGSKPRGSILSLFEQKDDHQGLSQQDLAFLTGLYQIPLDRRLTTQRSRLVTEMVRKASSSSE